MLYSSNDSCYTNNKDVLIGVSQHIDPKDLCALAWWLYHAGILPLAFFGILINVITMLFWLRCGKTSHRLECDPTSMETTINVVTPAMSRTGLHTTVCHLNLLGGSDQTILSEPPPRSDLQSQALLRDCQLDPIADDDASPPGQCNRPDDETAPRGDYHLTGNKVAETAARNRNLNRGDLERGGDLVLTVSRKSYSYRGSLSEDLHNSHHLLSHHPVRLMLIGLAAAQALYIALLLVRLVFVYDHNLLGSHWIPRPGKANSTITVWIRRRLVNSDNLLLVFKPGSDPYLLDLSCLLLFIFVFYAHLLLATIQYLFCRRSFETRMVPFFYRYRVVLYMLAMLGWCVVVIIALDRFQQKIALDAVGVVLPIVVQLWPVIRILNIRRERRRKKAACIQRTQSESPSSVRLLQKRASELFKITTDLKTVERTDIFADPTARPLRRSFRVIVAPAPVPSPTPTSAPALRGACLQPGGVGGTGTSYSLSSTPTERMHLQRLPSPREASHTFSSHLTISSKVALKPGSSILAENPARTGKELSPTLRRVSLQQPGPPYYVDAASNFCGRATTIGSRSPSSRSGSSKARHDRADSMELQALRSRRSLQERTVVVRLQHGIESVSLVPRSEFSVGISNRSVHFNRQTCNAEAEVGREGYVLPAKALDELVGTDLSTHLILKRDIEDPREFGLQLQIREEARLSLAVAVICILPVVAVLPLLLAGDILSLQSSNSADSLKAVACFMALDLTVLLLFASPFFVFLYLLPSFQHPFRKHLGFLRHSFSRSAETSVDDSTRHNKWDSMVRTIITAFTFGKRRKRTETETEESKATGGTGKVPGPGPEPSREAQPERAANSASPLARRTLAVISPTFKRSHRHCERPCPGAPPPGNLPSGAEKSEQAISGSSPSIGSSWASGFSSSSSSSSNFTSPTISSNSSPTTPDSHQKSQNLALPTVVE